MYFCTSSSRHLWLLLLGPTGTAALLYANSGVNPFYMHGGFPETEKPLNTFGKIGKSVALVKTAEAKTMFVKQDFNDLRRRLSECV